MIKLSTRSRCLNAFSQSKIVQRRSFLTSTDSKVQTFLLTRTINAPISDVYSVVSDISEYHKFIPYCLESFVNKKDDTTGKPTEAGMRVGFQRYDETFVCQINCSKGPSDRHVVVADSLTHSLFDFLQTKWTMRPHPSRHNATEAELSLKFKFKFSLYNNIASIFGKSVTEHVMKSFDRRIYQLAKRQASARPVD